jgi:4a-hydroxytetrahydrobiopterin dehydratase
MTDNHALLSRAGASAALPQWRYLLGRMHLTVEAGSFPAALALVQRVGILAEEQGHHPEMDLRYSRVHLATGSHDAGGVTARDVRLALAITAELATRGLSPEPTRVTELEIAIDALDIPGVLPFWAAVTGYRQHGDDDLFDPDRIGPTIWFQQMDTPRPQRNRIHIDVTVAHDEAEPRVARALAAGGRLVSDAEAPSFWVLADPEGNEACVCTWQGRD